MRENIQGDLKMLFGFSDEMTWLGMKFKDERLEEKYSEEDKNNLIKKSKIFSVLVILVFSFSLIISLILNKDLTANGFIVLSGLVVEIFLAILTHNCFIQPKFILFFINIRIFILYCFLIVILSLLFPKFSTFDNLRAAYGNMILINLLFFYLVDFNFVIQITIPIINSAILISFKLLGHYGDININIDVIAVYIYYILIFLVKRQELFTKKTSFYNSYKNSKYVEYTKNLIDVLNNMVISMSRKEIIFANKFTHEYLKKNHHHFFKNNNDSYIQDNKNELKFTFGEEKLLSLKLNHCVEYLFKSMILKDPESSKFKSGKNLLEISGFLFENHKNETNLFQRIGYFLHEMNEDSEYFDVYIRKVKFKEDIMEILIYDITEIKHAEKRDTEAKYKQKILGKIAHEFKTPLITITSLIGKINKNSCQLESRENKLLYHIDNFSNYVLCLVSDIIQYVSNSRNIKIHKTKICLREVLEFCFDVLKTLVECNENKCDKVETIFDFKDELNNVVIDTDEHRFKQLVLNFISNAVKFTQSGSIKLKAKINKNSSKLQIAIKDTGIGIKNEDKHLIFQENIQLRIDNDYNNQGSGLGLSISKNLAKVLNFESGFNSEFGKGSKFFINLHQFSINECIFMFKLVISSRSNSQTYNNLSPIREDSNIHINITERNKLTQRKSFDYDKLLINSTLTSKINIVENCINLNFGLFNDKKNIIVIVDDHKLVRETTINLMINVIGNIHVDEYTFVEASDGIDLLNIIKSDYNNKIKGIFVDENMEYLNGSETIKIIRNLEIKKKIPCYKIISITAFDDYHTKKKILDSGTDQIIHKPCSKSLMKDILKSIVFKENEH